MAVPYHIVATALKQTIDTEFVDLPVAAIHDKLHESLGYKGRVVGISPIRIVPTTGREIQQEISVFVQWYDYWEKDIDNEMAVDPGSITEYADRFQRAVERYSASASGTPEVWYFKVTSIEFPDDPTGNKTRFEANVVAYGDNTALTDRLA